jgi:steroid 5-alpha reductase family enzyme
VSDAATALLVAGATVAALMVVTWLASLPLRNASIVDLIWGLGFVLVAWAVRLTVDGNSARQWLLVGMTTLWGLRLSIYLTWRNHGNGEDFRYQAMRRRWGARFWWVSLLTVFALQGVLMWTVSLGVQLGQVPDSPGLGVIAAVGVLVWVVGLAFEAIGDAQLARFKADPANRGRVMDRGLWRYTRHPNYFGDACVWWGIALVAAESGLGAVGIVGAVVMTVLLRRVSGVTLLEKSLTKRRAGYDEYVARTSPFIPRPPRRPSEAGVTSGGPRASR